MTLTGNRRVVRIIAACFTGYAAFLAVMFLSVGLGSSGKVDMEGWLLLVALAVVVLAASVGIWNEYRSGPSDGSVPLLIGAVSALIVAIVSIVVSTRDLLTITAPMLLLAMSLFLLSRTPKGDA